MMPTVYSNRNQGWFPTLFNDMFNDNWFTSKAFGNTPAVNVSETENEYKIEVAAPGMAKEDFNVHLTHDNCISIKMEKKTEDNEKENKKNYLRREFGYSKFEQLLSLPDNADKNAISAKMNNGVLVIDIPKTKEVEKEKKNTCIEIK